MVTSGALAPATRPAPAERRRRGLAGVTVAFWLFVGPFLLGLVIFLYVPIIWSVVLSFSRAQNTVTPGWVGIQNYIDLLLDGGATGWRESRTAGRHRSSTACW